MKCEWIEQSLNIQGKGMRIYSYTTCVGGTYLLNDLARVDESYKFCPFCGKQLEVKEK